MMIVVVFFFIFIFLLRNLFMDYVACWWLRSLFLTMCAFQQVI